MKKVFLLAVLLPMFFLLNAREGNRNFLPEGVNYSPSVPTPEAWFGHSVGDRHLPYEEVLSYFREISRCSGRATMEEYGRTYENRPMVHLIFTSESNQSRLPELKKLHTGFVHSSTGKSIEGVPLVVLLGYGVHGNESSATNSSVLTAYYLAAAQGAFIDSLLDQTIILVDPCLNPDGFSRHAAWVNMHQGGTDVADPLARGFNEAWPGGRGNHYWFDLNRDYLFLVHPESRGRIAKFHEWLPNIVTDHHEMGANNTFFFQPGVPTRNNPLTPDENYSLTKEIAGYHMAKLDQRGELYYSEEGFDDFYLGKGSSYPDINGSVGILYEQAGYRGKIRETNLGIRTLADGIKNQFDVSLSTLEAALRMREKLLLSQQRFYSEIPKLSLSHPVKGYLVSGDCDPQSFNRLTTILLQHKIKMFHLGQEVTLGGKKYSPGSSLLVPLNQPQHRLIRSLFEVASSFTDTTFYDVSTWTLPYALNLPFTEISNDRELRQWLSDEITRAPLNKGGLVGKKDSYGWLFEWNSYTAPTALYELQKKGILTLTATQKFTAVINGQERMFGFGTIFIPAAYQTVDKEDLYGLMSTVSEATGIPFYGIETGHTETGIDLGSPDFVALKKPEILLLAGESVNSREAGELWFLFDQLYKIPVTLADISSIRSSNLARYTTIILPGGALRTLDKTDAGKIRSWVSSGGTLVACGDGNQWVNDMEIAPMRFKRAVPRDTTVTVAYAERARYAAIQNVAGAIFKAEMDITHPLCYGYRSPELAIFKSGTRVALPPSTQFAAPVKFAAEPWLSGYVSPQNVERLKNAPVVVSQKVGNGLVVSLLESFNFRGIWAGTNKIVANSVFFGPVVK